MEGIINFDKAAGISSARAVTWVKRLLPRGVKIGHAGTLDPFATGVLLMLVGRRATRLCESLMGQPKEYEACVKLGATTSTDDIESPEELWPGAAPVGIDEIQRAIKGFVGEIMQRPPAFSALKIGGRPAYQMARHGEAPQMEPRKVRVYAIDVLGYEWPLLRLRIECGRGTYVRALARDLGAAMNVGGHLTALRRTRIGEFHVEQAVRIEDLEASGVQQYLMGLTEPGR